MRPPRLARSCARRRVLQDRQGDGRRRGRHQVRPDGRPRRDASTRWSRPSASCASTASRSSPSASTCARPSNHLPVVRYWHPDEFDALERGRLRDRLRVGRRRPARAQQLPRRRARARAPRGARRERLVQPGRVVVQLAAAPVRRRGPVRRGRDAAAPARVRRRERRPRRGRRRRAARPACASSRPARARGRPAARCRRPRPWRAHPRCRAPDRDCAATETTTSVGARSSFAAATADSVSASAVSGASAQACTAAARFSAASDFGPDHAKTPRTRQLVIRRPARQLEQFGSSRRASAVRARRP